MAQDEKMFTCVRSAGSFRISPRNAAGWRAFGLWLAAFLTMLAVFLVCMNRLPAGSAAGAILALFLFATAIWAISMIRWMMARSEMIDLAELLKLKRELERQKRR